MSIERYDNCYTPTCDECGDTLPEEWDFNDAVDAKKAAGWKSVKDSFGWCDLCPACFKERNGAAADFGGEVS